MKIWCLPVFTITREIKSKMIIVSNNCWHTKHLNTSFTAVNILYLSFFFFYTQSWPSGYARVWGGCGQRSQVQTPRRTSRNFSRFLSSYESGGRKWLGNNITDEFPKFKLLKLPQKSSRTVHVLFDTSVWSGFLRASRGKRGTLVLCPAQKKWHRSKNIRISDNSRTPVRCKKK